MNEQTSISTTIAQKRGKPFMQAAVMVLIAVLSATMLTGIFSSDKTYDGLYTKLNEKRNNVMALTTAAAVASTAISLVPDDAGTPIANELMEIAKAFSFVLAIVILEKYLLSIAGFIFFAIVTPICCLLVAASCFMKPENASVQVLRQSALKFFALGLVLFLATPISVFLASKIDETYQASIDAVVAQESQVSEAAAKTVEEDEKAASKAESEKKKEASNPLEFVQQVSGDVVSNVGSVVEDAAETVTGALSSGASMVGNLIELFGVMIATSVLIPLIAPLVMYLAFKALFGQQIAAMPQQVILLPPQANEGSSAPQALPSKQEENNEAATTEE